ncbi:MAG: prepilin-type N-terminal cleavage/methylation domain-containing protein [Pseudohongiellaceae bacterium]
MNLSAQIQPGRRQTGFTLLEILLALGLTAMLLGLLSSGVYIVAEDWNRNADRLDNNLDESLAILQIERALYGAFPHSYADDDTLSRLVYFVGEDDSLSWVSTVSPQRTPGLMTWELTNDDTGVLLKLVPAFSDNPVSRLEEATPIPVLPNYEASFAYLYLELDGTRQWRDDWYGEELQSLPLAVYVKFTPLDDQDGRLEPLEIVARVLANEHRNLRPNSLQAAQ